MNKEAYLEEAYNSAFNEEIDKIAEESKGKSMLGGALKTAIPTAALSGLGIGALDLASRVGGKNPRYKMIAGWKPGRLAKAISSKFKKIDTPNAQMIVSNAKRAAIAGGLVGGTVGAVKAGD